jgi:hypothetical protein
LPSLPGGFFEEIRTLHGSRQESVCRFDHDAAPSLFTFTRETVLKRLVIPGMRKKNTEGDTLLSPRERRERKQRNFVIYYRDKD